MTDHTPTLPGEDVEAVIMPDHQPGAWTNCFCSSCMERRLADDRNNTYTPHDMADAFTQGWQRGFASGAAFARRVP